MVGTALLVRLILVSYALLHFGPAWFFSRGSEMGLLADSLVHGQGLSSPFGVPTGPTAIVAPGYPFLVSIVFRAFGSYTWTSALCLMLFHVACNTTTVWLIYRSGRLIANESGALVVAMFWACSLPLIWMPTIFWETSLSTLAIIGMVSIMLSVQESRPLHFWFVCGSCCGVAALFNPALVLSLGALVAYTICRTAKQAPRAERLAICCAGCVLVFFPWPLRNAHVFHACVLTRTTVGLELWMGNHPGSTGFLDASLFPTYNHAELADYQRRGEIGYTNHKGQLARTFIEAHPVGFLLLSSRRFVRFWTGSGTSAGSVLFSLHATLSSLLGSCGLYFLWRERKREVCLTFLLPFLLFPLPYYVTHAEFRYRLLLDPLLFTLSAKALSCFSMRLRSRRETRL